MVKKKFIDPATAAHFHLVHRSQRDPKAADPEAPQRVLAALPETGNQARKSVRGTQSTRAILQEQDLEGFDEAVDDPLEAAAIHALDGINELGLPAGYDYEQHMRPMGQVGGQFIAAPASVASMARSARSRLSQGTRHTAMTSASARSKRGELLLREDMPAAFASVEEEEEVGVGGAGGVMEVDREEERLQEEEAEAALEEDVWALMRAPWEEDALSEAGMDDDFVIKASRDRVDTEWLRMPAGALKQRPKGNRFDAAAAAAEAAAAAAEAAVHGKQGAGKKPNPFAELFGAASDEEEEEEEEVCPPGCDPSLYEKVCELRERRLEQEELYADFQKGVDGLKKENDALIRKEKVIDKALKDTEADIQAFQTEKQGKLNQLLVVVTLQVRQVQHLELAAGESQRTEAPASPGARDAEGEREVTSGPSAVLPADTSESLVFASSELARLRRRISELAREKSEARQVLKGLRAENGVLARQQGGKAEKLRELEARAYDVQMLKFGQVINLEAIESVSVNKGAEELKDRVRQLEAQQQRQLKGLHAKLREAKLELKAATEASTSSLNSVASLFERQQKLESDLNSKAAAAGREEASERRERQHLVQLVKIQAKEVEALKLEIKMLRRKGGHVYSAPVPA